MEKFGGDNADAIMDDINNLFQESAPYGMPAEHSEKKLTSYTTDGASVNTGNYNGVLTQMKRSRPWLLTIHCANHRMCQNFSLSLAQEFGQIAV